MPEEHKGEYANIIAQLADAIANGEAPTIYGDGTQTRDFTYVGDIVGGVEVAADHQLTKIYNLGTGENYDFNIVVEILNTELKANIAPEYVDNPIPEDVCIADTMADSTKCKLRPGGNRRLVLRMSYVGLTAIPSETRLT